MSLLKQIKNDKNTRFLIFLFGFFFVALIFLTLNGDIDSSSKDKKRYRDNDYLY
jgi:hypothetical protein